MNQSMIEAIARARAAIEARNPTPPTFGEKLIAEVQAQQVLNGYVQELVLNVKQQEAVDRAMDGGSFCLIGSAGTGKTTTTKYLIRKLMESNKIPPLERSSKWLKQDRPGVVLIAYTRRAVRQIAKQMPDDFKPHCITYHKLVEYEPEVVETEMPDGTIKISKPFLPQRRLGNPLPSNLRLVIIDESSMFSIDFWKILCRALPSFENVQFIFIGDINQIPPIYGDGILGIKMNQVPVVELTEVYRQALESPIIELALHVKDNKVPADLRILTKNWIKETPRGKVTLIPWKQKLTEEEAESRIHTELIRWVNEGVFNPDEDVILCPWGKRFGTINMNKSIGTALALQRDTEVFEIISGYEKRYYSVGDRVMVDKRDAIVTKIARNLRYIGKPPQPPSKGMNYWGWSSGHSASLEDTTDINDLLDAFADSTSEDRVQEASHAMTVKFVDDEYEQTLTKAGEFNITDLSYAMSIHKAQGSEWRRVFVITHDTHVTMLCRELIYTAFTRASEELYVIMPPTLLQRAASRPKIKGDTLEQKLKFFAQKHSELDLDEYEQ